MTEYMRVSEKRGFNIAHVEALQNASSVQTESKAVGGGEWSLEIYDIDPENEEKLFLFELVGSNGTQDEEPDDLYGQFDELLEAANELVL